MKKIVFISITILCFITILLPININAYTVSLKMSDIISNIKIEYQTSNYYYVYINYNNKYTDFDLTLDFSYRFYLSNYITDQIYSTGMTNIETLTILSGIDQRDPSANHDLSSNYDSYSGNKFNYSGNQIRLVALYTYDASNIEELDGITITPNGNDTNNLNAAFNITYDNGITPDDGTISMIESVYDYEMTTSFQSSNTSNVKYSFIIYTSYKWVSSEPFDIYADNVKIASCVKEYTLPMTSYYSGSTNWSTITNSIEKFPRVFIDQTSIEINGVNYNAVKSDDGCGVIKVEDDQLHKDMTDGNDKSQAVEGELGEQDSNLQDSINEYDDIESNLTDDFNDNISEINTDIDFSDWGSLFTSTAQFLSYTLNGILNLAPFNMIIAFVLVFGIALVFIGRGIH